MHRRSVDKRWHSLAEDMKSFAGEYLYSGENFLNFPKEEGAGLVKK